MRLYKTELYKICHRKISVMGLFVMLGILFIDYGEIQGVRANIAETEYGYMQIRWLLFSANYAVTMMGLGAVLLCMLSAVFSDEEQTKMKPLLLTTPEGPSKDIRAKIAAAYTVSTVLWLATTFILLLFHVTAFGLDGLELNTGDVIRHTIDSDVFAQPLDLYLAEVISVNFLAILELCSITLAVSAGCRSTFHSLCVSVLCILSPILAIYMIRGSYPFYLSAVSAPTVMLTVWSIILLFFQCLTYSAPFFLTWRDILIEISGIAVGNHGEIGTILFVVALGCIVMILCIIKSCRRYREPYTD